MKKEISVNVKPDGQWVKSTQRAIDRFQQGKITIKQFRNAVKCFEDALS